LEPVLIAMAPVKFETTTGTLELVVVLSPSWPESLYPQHLTVPPVINAHA
jgi:hypothetical protein